MKTLSRTDIKDSGITAMKCFSCENGDMHAQTVTVTEEIRDERYTFQTPGMMCESCQTVAFEGKDVSEQQRRLSDAYREAHDLLTSAQIKGLRERLGMSQLKFAAYLKVGVASIKRWELGAIQDEANDSYLRIKTDLVVAEANCAEIREILSKQLDEETPKGSGAPLVLRVGDEDNIVSLPSPLCDKSQSATSNPAANTQFAYAA